MRLTVRCCLSVASLMLLLVIAGCDTTNYEPLRIKGELSDLREEVDSLRQEIDQLKARGVQSPAPAPATAVDPGTVGVRKPAVVQPKPAPAEPPRPTLSLAEEAPIVAELERIDAFFDMDDEGYVIEADLKDCRQQNEALARMVEFGRLKKVLLAGNDADTKTYELLARMKDLEYLDLERSAPTVADMEQMKTLPKLSFLQLLRATLDEACFKVLAEFPALEQIRCAQTRVGDRELACLENSDTLRAIDLSDCNRVTTQGLESLATCPRLSFLKVWGKSIGNESMDVVATMKSLRVLGLTDTAVDDAGIAKLAGLKLSEIQLFRTLVGDGGVAVLADMPDLVKLNLRDTAISDQAMESIRGLKKLRVLDVSECNSPGITDTGLEAVAAIGSLEQLNLWSTKVTDEGVKKLAGLDSLTWLNLDNTAVTDATIQLIAENMPQLTWLHLGKTQVSDAGVVQLKSMENLTYLSLPATISDDAFYELYDALSPNGCEVERSSL